MKQKLVLAWVDHDGFELTGRYRDGLRQCPETRAVPRAYAAVWGDNTPELHNRLAKHVDLEMSNHAWIGFFLLDFKDDILNISRAKALSHFNNEKLRSLRLEHDAKHRRAIRAMP